MKKQEVMDNCLKSLDQVNQSLLTVFETIMPEKDRLVNIDDLNYQMLRVLDRDLSYENRCKVLVAYANKIALATTYNTLASLDEEPVSEEETPEEIPTEELTEKAE